MREKSEQQERRRTYETQILSLDTIWYFTLPYRVQIKVMGCQKEHTAKNDHLEVDNCFWHPLILNMHPITDTKWLKCSLCLG